jgi:hypothetical protein
MSTENHPIDASLSHVPPPIPGRASPSALALLDEWLNDDSGYDEETWPELKAALDRDRPSARRLFDG